MSWTMNLKRFLDNQHVSFPKKNWIDYNGLEHAMILF